MEEDTCSQLLTPTGVPSSTEVRSFLLASPGGIADNN